MEDVIDTPEKEDVQKPIQGFTQLSLTELQNIRRRGGGYRDMAAYIVICSGINVVNDRLCSTHGAKSVSQRTGMTYRTAENALRWLCAEGFIRPPEDGVDEHLGKVKSRNTEVRWVLPLTSSDYDVALSNAAVQGIGGNKRSPLQCLITEVRGTDDIGREQAVCDALILWLMLMREQDFDAHAGVSPSLIHIAYEPVTGEEGEDMEYFAEGHTLPIAGTNGMLVCMKPKKNRIAQVSHLHAFTGKTGVDEKLEQAEKDELASRYWHALKELLRLSFVYEAAVIWSGNPLDQRKGRQAEPLGTLYINDSWGRSSDSFALEAVNRVVWRRQVIPNEFEFNTDGELTFSPKNYLRYIVAESRLAHTMLLTQLRVRYWAPNEATVLGRELDKKRTEQMIASLDNL